MIFSRSRGKTRRRPVEPTSQEREEVDAAGSGSVEPGAAEAEPAHPGFGPYDAADVPGDGPPRIDLGGLSLPVPPGVEVHVQADPDGRIRQVMLAEAAGSLQLAAFAAPRTEGIWDDVRAQLRTSLATDRANPRDLSGDYGTELVAKLRTPDGPLEVRFVGVDGPRWFVQAVYQGKAADPEYSGPLRDVFRSVVVHRGTQAMPVHEALPLHLPAEAGAQMRAGAAAATEGATEPGGATPAQASDAAPGAGGAAKTQGRSGPRKGPAR